jgi:hypothetical protein
MDVAQVLLDAYGRIEEEVRAAVEGLDTAALLWRPDPDANPIGWLVWHLARVQDDHVADLAGTDQVWSSEAWPQRFGLDPDDMSIGYGHTSEQVGAVRPDGPDTLLAYLDAVAERTRDLLRGLAPDDLDRVVDASWDPPVTMGVRLVSVLSDDLQHAGQAAYLRGLYERTAPADR